MFKNRNKMIIHPQFAYLTMHWWFSGEREGGGGRAKHEELNFQFPVVCPDKSNIIIIIIIIIIITIISNMIRLPSYDSTDLSRADVCLFHRARFCIQLSVDNYSLYPAPLVHLLILDLFGNLIVSSRFLLHGNWCGRSPNHCTSVQNYRKRGRMVLFC